MTHADERALVATIARTWLRTPFHHGARIKGVGVDCAQLLAAVFDEAELARDVVIPDYSCDWFLHEDRERYLEAIAPHAGVLPEGASPDVGDMVLFRYGRAVSHAGIVVEIDPEGHPAIVHAMRGLGVILDTLAPTHHLGARYVATLRLRQWLA